MKREVINVHRETNDYEVKYKVSGRGARVVHAALQGVFDKVDHEPICHWLDENGICCNPLQNPAFSAKCPADPSRCFGYKPKEVAP